MCTLFARQQYIIYGKVNNLITLPLAVKKVCRIMQNKE
jgi:hypothetical protein